ncbi:MAG: Skp family chaperone for outer membrane protein [Glaciecola sp.]|jgi:Skp family chaperone for outer membrane proteins
MKSITLNNNRMKTKVLFLLAFASLMSWSALAQRGVRIGYIDTEYILQNVPEYQDASAQLESKVLQWKNDVEKRLSVVEQKKKQLSSESVLLTPELINERQEEITVEENEILDYQQKRFGPNGDLMIQRKQLMQPVQDQIFAAVQEIATSRSYDFVFDKSTDVVMLYSADRYDISDQVLRSITRSSKRTQTTNKQERKAAEAEDVVPEEVNEKREAAAQEVADKKAEREKTIADKRAEQLADRDAKKKILEDKKQAILDARAKAREDKLNERNGEEDKKTLGETIEKATDSAKTTDKVAEKPLSAKEARKKALEDKKKKILADRQAKLEAKKAQDSIAKAKNNNN